ncbi:unnamed protein product [Sphenostylis stenocarpa]|uniref:Uncharacterized protein n=1 Tax=Sphenostylis stenocarpa TaxID=92480 RepID=A0AA86V3H1_9FABA|nr:unnamed protein product [Sphenostylis stenocarpa]
MKTEYPASRFVCPDWEHCSKEMKYNDIEESERNKYWKGRQKRRRKTTSLLSLSGLQAMNWKRCADACATLATALLFSTILDLLRRLTLRLLLVLDPCLFGDQSQTLFSDWAVLLAGRLRPSN